MVRLSPPATATTTEWRTTTAQPLCAVPGGTSAVLSPTSTVNTNMAAKPQETMASSGFAGTVIGL